MPESPQISVVMPVRDGESTVRRAIRSVLSQSAIEAEPRWELLVIDDESRDGSRHVAETMATEDRRIRVLRNDGSGLVAALETGCRAARGRFIARLDVDDECLAGRLAAQAEHLLRHPEIGVVGCLVEFGGDPVAAEGYARHVEWTNSLVRHEQILNSRLVDSPLPHPSVMFRRELLDRFGGYRDGPFPEDHELWLRWLDAGVRFSKVPEMLVRWNDPADRLSRTDSRYSTDATARLRCRHLAVHLHRRAEHRPLWLWGSGRITRRRFDALAEHGVEIAGFIDIDPNRVGQRSLGVPVVGPDRLPSIESSFVVSGVGVRGARDEIRTSLLASGRREGEDFLLAG